MKPALFSPEHFRYAEAAFLTETNLLASSCWGLSLDQMSSF